MALDTHVRLLNDGIIGGYAALWRQWSKGGNEPEPSYLVPGEYRWRRYPGTPLRWDHGAEDFGYLLTVQQTPAGLYVKGRVHDDKLLLLAAAEQLFFSINFAGAYTRVKGGVRYQGGRINEVSLTASPAFKPQARSVARAAQGWALLDTLKSVYTTASQSESALTLTTRPVGRPCIKTVTAEVVILGGWQTADGWRYDVLLPTGEHVEAGPGKNIVGNSWQFYIPEESPRVAHLQRLIDRLNGIAPNGSDDDYLNTWITAATERLTRSMREG